MRDELQLHLRLTEERDLRLLLGENREPEVLLSPLGEFSTSELPRAPLPVISWSVGDQEQGSLCVLP